MTYRAVVNPPLEDIRDIQVCLYHIWQPIPGPIRPMLSGLLILQVFTINILSAIACAVPLAFNHVVVPR